ncbi:MAG: PAS domain-containing sensor histidine kinase, partial [Planctomycetota bacterium]
EDLSITYEAFLECVHPEDRELVVHSIDACVYNNNDYSIEHRIVRPDGTVRWVSETGNVMRDEEGRTLGMMGIVQDITERRQIAEELAESQKRFQLAINAATDGLWDWNVQTGEVYYSPVWGTILEEEQIESNYEFWKLKIHPEDKQGVMTSLQNHLDGQTTLWHNEHRLLTGTGQWKWVFGRGKVIDRDDAGQPLRMIGTLTDISARKQAEAHLRISEHRFRALFDNMPSGVAVYRVEDDGKRFIFEDMNDIGLKSLNLSREDVVGSSLAEILPGTPQMKGLFEAFERVWKTGITEHVEPAMYHDEKIDRWFENVVYRLPSGELVAVFHDVTIQEQAKQDRDRFLRILASKNEDLESIMYATSHDLRSPLVNIHGYGNVLSEQLDELLNCLDQSELSESQQDAISVLIQKEIPQSFHFIEHNSKKLDVLQKGLLEICTLGRITLKIEQVDVKAMLSKLLDSYRLELEMANVEVILEDMPTCYGDEVLLEQAFGIIIDNAMKFRRTDRHGIIRIYGERGQGCFFYIEDDGIGIPEQYHHKIFEIFHRLDPNGPVAGKGLGLTLAKRIISKHGGDIKVHSQAGQGSCFEISLPDSQEQVQMYACDDLEWTQRK